MNRFYKVIVHYLWYDEKHNERDLVIPCEEMGAEIIRQTPMRGLGATKVWYKILHIKAKEEHLDNLYKYIGGEGEQMIVEPYNHKVHLTPTEFYR